MDKEEIHRQGDIRAYLVRDEDARNPLDEFDPMGELVTWHRVYAYGVDGEKKYGTPEDFEAVAKVAGYTMLPVYMLDHSGLTVNTTGFTCPWDSGRLGYIYVTKEQVKAEYGDNSQESEEKAKDFMRSEINTLDQYMTGDVWGVVIEKETECGECGHKEDEHLDSCWGFYGREYAEEECKRMFEEQTKEHMEVAK